MIKKIKFLNYRTVLYLTLFNNYVEMSRDQKSTKSVKPQTSHAFHSWKERIHEIVYEKIELYLDDLPDVDYRIMFSNGKDPTVVANEILKEVNDMNEWYDTNVDDIKALFYSTYGKK